MRVAFTRSFVIAALCATMLAGCETTQQYELSSNTPNSFGIEPGSPGVVTNASFAPETPIDGPPSAAAGMMGRDQKDDLNIGKQHFRDRQYGLAERHFRRAVEMSPRDAEAWIGLAASYDRLKRFDHADRAYSQAIAILGPTPEILNNQGFSYLLRGDYKRARSKFFAAREKDPANPRIQRNIELMEASLRDGKGIAPQ
jgi:tetratricopeptide (TPR) repeat protein